MKKRIHGLIFINSLLSLASVKITRVLCVKSSDKNRNDISGDSFSVSGLSCFLSCVLEIWFCQDNLS